MMAAMRVSWKYPKLSVVPARYYARYYGPSLEPGLMDSLLRCLITPPQPIDRRRSTMASAGVPDRMVEPSPYRYEAVDFMGVLG